MQINLGETGDRSVDDDLVGSRTDELIDVLLRGLVEPLQYHQREIMHQYIAHHRQYFGTVEMKGSSALASELLESSLSRPNAGPSGR